MRADAIASDYAARGVAVDATRVVLTASTSEAYAILFKLLTDPGDAVLVPQPSYPLFELLTRLDGVDAAAYRLQRADDWAIDRDSVVRAVTSKTRAILVVSPNNPTGSMLRADDRDWLVGHRSSSTTLRLSLTRCSPTIPSRRGRRPRRLPVNIAC